MAVDAIVALPEIMHQLLKQAHMSSVIRSIGESEQGPKPAGLMSPFWAQTDFGCMCWSASCLLCQFTSSKQLPELHSPSRLATTQASGLGLGL